MIKVEGIQKSFGEKAVLQNVSFILNRGEKVGLIGKNGSGKTTLLKIIIGRIEPDEGSIVIDKKERIGYLPQTMESNFGETVKKYFCDNRAAEEWQIKKSLGKLGIHGIDLNRKLTSFSGGEITRIALAKILTKNPTTLLLDEPTNHLDIEGILYLQKFLSSFNGGVLLVSHDRWILDNVAKKIIELQLTEKGRIAKVYPGNFSDYKETRQKEIEKQVALYNIQQKKIKTLKKDIYRLKERSKKSDRNLISKLRADGLFMNSRGLKFARRAKAEERSIERFLKNEKRIEKPQKEKSLHFFFGSYLAKGQRVFQAKNLSFKVEKKILFKSINLEFYGKERLVLMGPNGSGKTTLVKVLLCKIKPNKGEIKLNPNVKIGYLPQEVNFESGSQEKTVLEEFESGIKIEESEGRRLLGKFLFSGEGQAKKLKNLSIGERKRLYFAKIVASGANFLALDEPTNHLDILSIEAIEKALSQFRGAILVVSHDRYFLKNIGIKKLYYLKEGKFREIYSLQDIEKMIKLSSI